MTKPDEPAQVPVDDPQDKQLEKVKSDSEKPIEKIKAEDEKFLKSEVEKFQFKPEKEHKIEKIEKEKFEKEHKAEKLEKEKHEKEKNENEKDKNDKLEKEKADKVEGKEHKVEKLEHKLEKLELEKNTPEVFEGPGPLDRESLLQHAQALEAMGRDLRHFIEQSERPDLSQGALRNEPDQQGGDGSDA
jgi:ATP-dependent DNA helicase UvrD/PcrA